MEYELFPDGELNHAVAFQDGELSDHLLEGYSYEADPDDYDPGEVELLEDEDIIVYIERLTEVFCPDADPDDVAANTAMFMSVKFALDVAELVAPSITKWTLLNGVPDYFESPDAQDFSSSQVQRYLKDRPFITALAQEYLPCFMADDRYLHAAAQAAALHFMAMDSTLHKERQTYIDEEVARFHDFLEVADLTELHFE